MALTHLNTTVDDLRSKANAARADLNAKIDAVRANTALSPSGKQQQIAKVYLSARATIRNLEKREAEAVSKTRTDLERRVFGQVATDAQSLMAYRDAQDRAARLTPSDKHHAQSLLRSAHLSGDNVLAAAIVGQAINHGWDELVTDHVSKNPTAGADLEDLSRIARFESDAQAEMQRMFDYSDNRPRELDRLQERALNNVAEGNADAPY